MAIGVAHVAGAEHVDATPPIDRARHDERVLGLASIGAAIHAQRAADAARNAAQERQPRNAGLLRRARDLNVGHRGAGTHGESLNRDLAETAAESTTTPGTPPSRTMRLEPRPMTVTAISAGVPRK